MENNDFYRILEVDPEADVKAVKAAYRKLALKYHPDRNSNDPAAAEQMKAVNEAYAVLSDPEKRSRYDSLRTRFGSAAYQRFKQAHTEQDIFHGSDINSILEELAKNFNVRGFDALFKDIYGQGYRTFEFQKPGFSGRGFVFTGPFGAGSLRGGRGRGPGRGPRLGGGSNKLIEKIGRYAMKKMSGVDLPEHGEDDHDVIHIPAEQMKAGGPYAYHCKKRDKKLIVKIPPKIADGKIIRLKGLGGKGRHGGQDGDLFIKVKEKKSVLHRVKDFVKEITG